MVSPSEPSSSASTAPAPRFERKFFVRGLALPEVERLIRTNRGQFREIYAERAVNNIYLDTPRQAHYRANKAGVARRLKARVRWYGPAFGVAEKPVLEFKIKQGLVGWKRSCALEPLRFQRGFSHADLPALFQASQLADWTQPHLHALEPALFNRYCRRYYLSGDGRFRLTLDSELRFHRLDRLDNEFLGDYAVERCLVIELKYADAQDHDAERITGQFPFRVSRVSKYVLGVDLIYG